MVAVHEFGWIVRLPGFAVRLLGWLPFARQTVLAERQSISVHSHQFTAVYFVDGVATLEVDAKTIALPRAAAVIVWRGARHGWRGVQTGALRAVIRHFHPGHAAHTFD